MKNYKFSLTLYRLGDENYVGARYFVHMNELLGENSDPFSFLDVVTTFENLTVGQLNYINDAVLSYKGIQSGLLSKIHPIFDNN